MILHKKKFNLLWLVMTALLLSSGCQSVKRIPAGDISIYKKFADEIKIMHSKASPDSELKFSAAKILFDNVDFSFIRNPKDLVKILGLDDARVINAGGKDYIQYRFRFNDKYILARFLLIQNTLISFRLKSNVTGEQTDR
ncbi:MAG: hypothetical protein L3J71_10420 [Victivallaceae bacterium]|nr:hypothetical protein [Victivallaceae bacterium]